MTDWGRAAAVAAEFAELTEADGAVVRQVVDQLVADGVMKLWVPARYGGGEAHLQVGLDAMAVIAHGCGSAGWAVMIANTTGLLASRLSRPAGELLFGDSQAICGGFAPPVGTAIIGATTARVTGQWPWGSGSSHATTMGGGVRYVDGAGTPVELANKSRTGFAFFHGGVELLDRFLDSQGGSNCSLWIVLMSSRKSEHGEDSIAQQFLDVTAEALDVFSTPAVIGSQPDANVFRIGTGSVGGEVDQICEQHRDDSSFLACS